jgi:hypothetical protein
MMTLLADKMNMLMAMMPVATLVFAQGIAYRVIRRGNGVDKAAVHKGLQGAIDSDSIKGRSRFFFDISMRKGAGLV